MTLPVAVLFAVLAGAGNGALLRALPWPERVRAYRLPTWLGGKTFGEKPLGCAPCTAGWGALFATLQIALVGIEGFEGWKLLAVYSLVWTAGAGGAVWIIAQVFPPPFEPPEG